MTDAKAQQREIEAFLDDPTSHQQFKQSWRPYLEATLGFCNHWYPAMFSRDLVSDEPKPVRCLANAFSCDV